MTASDPHISAEKQGVLGLLTLKRPAALNALNIGMVRALDAQLVAWSADEDVRVVAIRGEGPRAFCAGGDIRAWITEGPDAALAFLAAEYRLNHRIAAYAKPVVALMHGVTMGGGAGLSVHARHRVADPGLVFAMPEANIGFVPDIGSTYFLPRCPDQMGLYLALTAGRMGCADVMAAGMADACVALTDFDALLEKLAVGESIKDVTTPSRRSRQKPRWRHTASRWPRSSARHRWNLCWSGWPAMVACLRRTPHGRSVPIPPHRSSWLSICCVGARGFRCRNACNRNMTPPRICCGGPTWPKACVRPSSTRTAIRTGIPQVWRLYRMPRLPRSRFRAEPLSPLIKALYVLFSMFVVEWETAPLHGRNAANFTRL
jgi:enoyl-CoA hydratase/carnithine racemase